MLRSQERSVWAAKGLLLWLLLRKPWLRFLPLPYPSTTTLQQWKEQALRQAMDGVIPKQHLKKAELAQTFNMQSLGDCSHLRDRLGLAVSFMEDPKVEGMLCGRAVKGLGAKLKKQAQAEALEAAKAAEEAGSREQEARSMIGPKGGLPTLRGDLLRLAALLHVKLEDGDTVTQLKEKIKPTVALLKEKPEPKVKAKSKGQARGAIPKSAPRHATCSSVSMNDRPLTVIADQQRQLGVMVDHLAREISALRRPMVEQESEEVEEAEMISERVDSLRDCAVECIRLRRAVQGQVDGPVWRGKADRPDQRRDRASNGSLEDPPNPFVLDQKLKRNQAQLIAQAWKRHEEDRRKVSWALAS